MNFINAFIFGLAYWFAPWTLKRATSGTYDNVLIAEGQKWRLTKPDEYLPDGIYVVKLYGGDRVIIRREDFGRTNLPDGCLPLYGIDFLLSHFELVK